MDGEYAGSVALYSDGKGQEIGGWRLTMKVVVGRGTSNMTGTLLVCGTHSILEVLKLGGIGIGMTRTNC